MDSLIISSKDGSEEIESSLTEACQNLEDRLHNINFTKRESPYRTYFTLSADIPAEQHYDFLFFTAKCLADYILTYKEDEIIERLLCGQLGFLDEDTKNNFRQTFPSVRSKEDLFNKRRHLLFLSFLKYLSSVREIFIDGFIDFRLRSYWNFLSNMMIIHINNTFKEEELQSNPIYFPPYNDNHH